MEMITIQIDAAWAKRIRSRFYSIIAALQGIAFGFAPIIIFMTAKGYIFRGAEWIVAPICFACILLVGFFNIRLAQATVEGINQREPRT